MPKPSAFRSQLLSDSVADIASNLVRAAPPIVDAALPPLTAVDRGLPQSRNSKTNPPKGVKPALTPRHLAVARMLAQGKTNPQIATALGVTRQAVWNWSRSPEVIEAVRRTHAEMVKVGTR
jgi:DNA-binding NarL/FixJ family response regulator